MTDDDRHALRTGDRVVYLDDFGAEHVATVRHAPTQLPGGVWVAWFQEVVGCYLLSRVVRKLEGPTMTAREHYEAKQAEWHRADRERADAQAAAHAADVVYREKCRRQADLTREVNAARAAAEAEALPPPAVVPAAAGGGKRGYEFI